MATRSWHSRGDPPGAFLRETPESLMHGDDGYDATFRDDSVVLAGSSSPGKRRIIGVEQGEELTMEGVIEHIYRKQEKGMIRGDDGLQLPFRKSALNGVEFLGLCSGQRVSYLIQEGWLGKEAVNVHRCQRINIPEMEI
jgi:cold shock CspA family protein